MDQARKLDRQNTLNYMIKSAIYGLQDRQHTQIDRREEDNSFTAPRQNEFLRSQTRVNENRNNSLIHGGRNQVENFRRTQNGFENEYTIMGTDESRESRGDRSLSGNNRSNQGRERVRQQLFTMTQNPTIT